MDKVNYPNAFPTKDVSQLVDNELTSDFKKLPKDDIMSDPTLDAVHSCIYDLVAKDISFTAFDVTRILKATRVRYAKHSCVKKMVHETMKKCMPYINWKRSVKNIDIDDGEVLSDVISAYVYSPNVNGLDNNPQYDPNWLDNYKGKEWELFQATRKNAYKYDWVKEIQNGWIMPKYDMDNNVIENKKKSSTVENEEVEVLETLDGRIYVPGRFLTALGYSPFEELEIFIHENENRKKCLVIDDSTSVSSGLLCVFYVTTNKDNSVRLPKSALEKIFKPFDCKEMKITKKDGKVICQQKHFIKCNVADDYGTIEIY